MSVWTHFKIRDITKDSKVSIRKACHTVLNSTSGGEFSISKYPNDYGQYTVSVCLCGNECYPLLKEIIDLCKLIDKRSNIEIEVYYMRVY